MTDKERTVTAMQVTRTPDGYQPPLNPDWTSLDKLRWAAATTGLNIDIAEMPAVGTYWWAVDGMKGGYHTFASMWAFLVGVGIGAQLTQGVWPCEPYQLAAELAAERDKANWSEAVARDERAAKKTASDAADRFRDVVSEALGLDENPGDDVLIAQLRKAHSKSGPEPTRWRDFLTGGVAHLERNGITIGAALAGEGTHA